MDNQDESLINCEFLYLQTIISNIFQKNEKGEYFEIKEFNKNILFLFDKLTSENKISDLDFALSTLYNIFSTYPYVLLTIIPVNNHKKIYDIFIKCYTLVINKEITEETTKVKKKLIDILTLITKYISCPIEIFEELYQQLSFLSLKKNFVTKGNDIQLNNEIFSSYLDLLSSLYNCEQTNEISSKSFPSTFIMNHQKGVIIKPSNTKKQLALKNDFYIFGWFYLKQKAFSQKEKRYLLQIEECNGSKIEVYFYENYNTIGLFYKYDEYIKKELVLPLDHDIKNDWITFTFHFRSKGSRTNITIYLLDCRDLGKPKLNELNIELGNFTQGAISTIIFYENLDCLFTSIVIGRNINVNKLFQEEKLKLLNCGIVNQKTYKQFLNTFLGKDDQLHAICVPFNASFNSKTMNIELQEISRQYNAYIPNTTPVELDDMKFSNNIIYSFYDNSKRIQFLGGINALLPLFEILFAQHNLIKPSSISFEKLIMLITKLLTKSKYNFINALANQFFQCLSVFMENIPKQYFTKNIYDCLLIINDFYLKNLQFYNEFFNGKIKKYNAYLEYIFLNEKIIRRFPHDTFKDFWEQILIILKDIFNHHKMMNDESNTEEILPTTQPNLDYSHISYILNTKKIISILLYYESKAVNKYCCERHSLLYVQENNDDTNNDIYCYNVHHVKKGFLKHDLRDTIEPLERIVYSLIQLDLLTKQTELLEIFSLMPFDISPCLKLFLINILVQLIQHPNFTEENLLVEQLKKKDILKYLYITLGNAVISEKAKILSVITLLDTTNSPENIARNDIEPLIRDLIPNLIYTDEQNGKESGKRKLSKAFNTNSQFYRFYSKYREIHKRETYNFPQFLELFYPKYINSANLDFSQDAINIQEVLFDWMKFWFKQIKYNKQTNHKQIIEIKICTIFELICNFVIRINSVNLLIENICLIENFFRISENFKLVDLLTNSTLLWFFIFENYYFCYRVIKQNIQSTLIGKNKWFNDKITMEEINMRLEKLSSKCNGIICEMAKRILQTGNYKQLYYILTWGTYQKILYQSTDKEPKSPEELKILNSFIQRILDSYLGVIKEHKLLKSKTKESYNEFTGIILTLIYDFLILFPSGTQIILDSNDAVKLFKKSFISYLPEFFMNKTNWIKEYSQYLEKIIMFSLDILDIQEISDTENESKLSNCEQQEKQQILDDMVNNIVYNKNYLDKFYNKLHYLSETKPQVYNKDGISMTYLSIPLVKNILLLLYSLTLSKENELKYLNLIESYLINLIIMSTIENNKKSKNYQSLKLQEINKVIESVIIFGLSILLEKGLDQQTNDEQFLSPIQSVLYFSKKILTHKNSSSITQSPLYNVFEHIIQDSNEKHSLLDYLKQETNKYSLNEIGKKFIQAKTLNYWEMLIYKNRHVFDIIKAYFQTSDIVNHYIRIHCEIKDIIPIYNNVDPKAILPNSLADNFNLETCVDIALVNSGMGKHAEWNNAKKQLLKMVFNQLEKLKHKISSKDEITKNIYKNVKQNLFAWKGLWSDKTSFYKYPNCLKVKQLYHLTKEFTTPLLIPILDMDSYLPSFKSFDKNILFTENYELITNYGVSLNIDKMITLIKGKNQSENTKNKHISKMMSIIKVSNIKQPELNETQFKACMIKQTHHLPGMFSLSKEQIIFEYIYYENGTGVNKNHLLYDEDNQTCFGSFFKSYPKDKYKSMLIINLKSINLVLKRTYFYSNNSLEIFTKNNKSYYFHFANYSERSKIFEQIKQYKEFKTIIKNRGKKDSDELFCMSNLFQERMKFSETNFTEYIRQWESGKISNLEFIMFCNLVAGRSLRDLTQYPIFPWTLIEYFRKELTTDLRPFGSPMGMLEMNSDMRKRKELFIKEFELMEREKESEIKTKGNEKENNDKSNPDQILSHIYSAKEGSIPLDEIASIPYVYGTHYSNPVYVSHFLTRIFPFSQIRIELQGDNFDSTRLFCSVPKTFLSVTTQKTDVRELLPEFFILPEMFKNLNCLNLTGDSESNLDIQVKLPPWSKKKTYLFVKEMRKSLEHHINDENNGINKWLNLIIGSHSRGQSAKDVHNLFMYHTYPAVISLDKYKTRDNIEKEKLNMLNYYFRVSEIGLCPHVLLKEDIPNKHPTYRETILSSSDFATQEIEVKKLSEMFNHTFLRYSGLHNDDHVVLYSTDNILYSVPLLNTKRVVTEKIYDLNQNMHFQYLKQDNKKNISPEFPVVCLSKVIIQTGFWNGTLFIQQHNNSNVDILRIKYDKSKITVIVCDKNEKYCYLGTAKGSILIYKIIKHKEENPQDFMEYLRLKRKVKHYYLNWKFKKSLNDHSKEISSIIIEDTLNIIGSSSKDGYIHLYTKPGYKLFRSIKLQTFPYADYFFISNNPVPCFVAAYKNQLLSWTINGSHIEIERSFPPNKKYNESSLNEGNFSSYYIFTDVVNFSQYLILGTTNGFVQIREFPEMKLLLYEKVFDGYSVDKIIPFDTANNSFIVHTNSDKAIPRAKIIYNPTSSNNVIFKCHLDIIC